MKGVEVFSELSKRVQALALENSTTILTGVGTVGTVATAVLTGKASFKAADILSDPDNRQVLLPEGDRHRPINRWEQFQLIWPQYVPAVGVGGLTIASIIFAHRISAKEIAAMATAAGISERAFSEYKEKVVEKLGKNKETAVRDEIAQDRVNANPATDRNVIITGSGEVLCYDALTDRYFTSTVEEIKKAENTVNFEIVNHDSVPLSRFYDELNINPTPYSDTVGWNIDNRCEVQFSAVISKDGRPCMAIEFARWPKPNFEKAWD